MNIPTWALQTLTPEDQNLAKDAHQQGKLQINWPNTNALRNWAKQQNWPNPFFGFEQAFITKMLETKENFELAIQKSGIEMQVLRRDYTISAEKIRELDSLYEDRAETGRPNQWGTLVEELRQIRRAVEAGVVIQIEGENLILNWQNFYGWAHGRYHMLEDGYDKWIGDDK